MARIFFEDIVVGSAFESSRRTVTEADIAAFAGVSGDFDKLHTDDVFIRESTPFRGRIAHGLLVFAIQSGLRAEVSDWQTIGYLGCDRRFRAPVYPGDTVAARYIVSDARSSSSRTDSGVVTLSVDVFNVESDELVQSGTDVFLVLKREAAG
ncbi:MAG: MaoC/PaaZ C-terminal domain-containing protein [Actinomycetota bacterium]|nr:MaoC/PaaZ C-terminal domain-containing protein [Actinomycetota bacterium]